MSSSIAAIIRTRDRQALLHLLSIEKSQLSFLRPTLIMVSILQDESFQPDLLRVAIIFMVEHLRAQVSSEYLWRTFLQCTREKHLTLYLDLLFATLQLQPYELESMLMQSIDERSLFGVEYLARRQVDYNYRDGAPLIKALYGSSPNFEMIKTLVRLGADPSRSVSWTDEDADPEPYLNLVILRREEAIVEYLLDIGTPNDDLTVDLAIRMNEPRILKLLLNAGVPLGYVNTSYMKSIISDYCSDSHHQLWVELYQVLVDANVIIPELLNQMSPEIRDQLRVIDPDEVPNDNPEQLTTLMSTARDGPPYLVRGLSQRTQNVHHRDSRGNTALHYAVQSRNRASVQYLLDNKASVKIKNWDGQTPLDWIYSSDSRMIAMLKYQLIKQSLRSKGLPDEIAGMVVGWLLVY